MDTQTLQVGSTFTSVGVAASTVFRKLQMKRINPSKEPLLMAAIFELSATMRIVASKMENLAGVIASDIAIVIDDGPVASGHGAKHKQNGSADNYEWRYGAEYLMPQRPHSDDARKGSGTADDVFDESRPRKPDPESSEEIAATERSLARRLRGLG